MSLLKFPDYSGPMSVTVGSTTASVPNYGNASVLFDDVMSRRMAVLEDPEGPSSVTVLTQPEQGRAIDGRSDNRISLDLNGIKDAMTLTFQYERVVGGVTSTVEATVNVLEALHPAGWSCANYYLPEIDPATDAVKYDPAENARDLYVSETGLTDADIQAAEGLGSAPNAAFLRDTPATGGGGAFYGETEALALHPDPASRLFTNIRQNERLVSWRILLKRGDNFTSSVSISGIQGRSALHPFMWTSYGTGELPILPADGPQTSSGHMLNSVVQDVFFPGGITVSNGKYLCYDNLKNPGLRDDEYPFKYQGNNTFITSCTLRRYISNDAVKVNPVNGTTWHVDNNDRTSGMYQSNVDGLLVEKCFISLAGWQPGYRGDRDGSFPKSPEDRSHAIYMQSDNINCTFRYLFIDRPSFSDMQPRSAGNISMVYSFGADDGISPGNGLKQGGSNPFVVDEDGSGDIEANWGQWCAVVDYVRSASGQKDTWDSVNGAEGEEGTLGGGVNNKGPLTTFERSMLVDGNGAGSAPLVTEFDIGPVGQVNKDGETYEFKNTDAAAPFPHPAAFVDPDYQVVNNWFRNFGNPDRGSALPQATRDSFTSLDYERQLTSNPAATLDDMYARWRTLDAPWEEIKGAIEYFQAGFQWPIRNRTMPQVVRFEPRGKGDFDGFRADTYMNWETEDLPGSVAGDGVDFGGYFVEWNITTDNPLASMTMGAGGSIEIRGGLLKTIAQPSLHSGGNSVRIRSGGKFEINGYASGNPLSVTVETGRFVNAGSMTGQADLSFIGWDAEGILATPGGSFTLKSGRTLTIGGMARVGFDGSGGGAASITLEAGSTTLFRPGTIAAIDGMLPYVGSSTTSRRQWPKLRSQATVGAETATVLDIMQYKNLEGFIVLDEISGPLANNDLVRAESMIGEFYEHGEVRDMGSFFGTPDVTLGQMREFRSGHYGLTATNVTSSITLGGTLQVEVAAMDGAFSHTLIQAGTVSGTFDTYSVLGLGARDATITISGTEVTIDVVAGTGQVTVA